MPSVSEYGAATVKRHDDGSVTVVEADTVIGIAVELLTEGRAQLPVGADGCIALAGDPAYRYRPVRFEPSPGDQFTGGPVAVVVCERVEA